MDLYRLSDTTRNSLWIEADGNPHKIRQER